MPWCLQWVRAVGQVRLGCSPCDCPWFRAQLLRSTSLSPARNVALSVAVFGGRGLENPVAQHGFSLQTHPTPLLTLERDVCLLVLSPQKPQVPWARGGSRSQPCIPLELNLCFPSGSNNKASYFGEERSLRGCPMAGATELISVCAAWSCVCLRDSPFPSRPESKQS